MTTVIVISDADNVATALEALDAGVTVHARGMQINVREPIPRGHKIAIRAIAEGAAVMKYGSPIGVASAEIPAGAHVHTHNVSSTRGRGDLPREEPAVDGRLAEPVNDRRNP